MQTTIAVETRKALAAGKHLTTLAFSELGSRSHFWAPLGTATADGANVKLSARKSWVTSARTADSYVWSSKPPLPPTSGLDTRPSSPASPSAFTVSPGKAPRSTSPAFFAAIAATDSSAFSYSNM
jgi:hypothetical protein